MHALFMQQVLSLREKNESLEKQVRPYFFVYLVFVSLIQPDGICNHLVANDCASTSS
jgi:hypothetical protein